MLIKFIKPDFEFNDGRGSLTQLVHDGWKQTNYITSNPGAIRGNHYHKNNNEAFFIISGEIKLKLNTLDNNNVEEHLIKAGDFFIIPANVNHSFEFTKPSTFISFYDKGVEEGDTMDIHTI